MMTGRTQADTAGRHATDTRATPGGRAALCMVSTKCTSIIASGSTFHQDQSPTRHRHARDDARGACRAVSPESSGRVRRPPTPSDAPGPSTPRAVRRRGIAAAPGRDAQGVREPEAFRDRPCPPGTGPAARLRRGGRGLGGLAAGPGPGAGRARFGTRPRRPGRAGPEIGTAHD